MDKHKYNNIIIINKLMMTLFLGLAMCGVATEGARCAVETERASFAQLIQKFNYEDDRPIEEIIEQYRDKTLKPRIAQVSSDLSVPLAFLLQ